MNTQSIGNNRANLLPLGSKEPARGERAAASPHSYARCPDGWHSIGIAYRGWPIYVRLFDGTMAYEADGERLVSLPEEVEERIADVLQLDYLVGTLSAEAIDALKQRAN